MSEPHSDALVFFGATGDLAYKKIFPALQAMVKRGRLDVPVIGVAKAGWTLDQLRARARESLRSTAESMPRPLTSCPGYCATSAAITTARRRSKPCARRWARPSGRPITSPFRLRCSAWSWNSSPSRAARRAPASSSKSRSATTSGRRRELNRPCSAISMRRHLPHRSLPRQGAGAEPCLLPLRQPLPRAYLEQRVRRERADHDV